MPHQQGDGVSHPDYHYVPQHNESAATRVTSESVEQTAARLQEAARQRILALGGDPGPPMKRKMNISYTPVDPNAG